MIPVTEIQELASNVHLENSANCLSFLDGFPATSLQRSTWTSPVSCTSFRIVVFCTTEQVQHKRGLFLCQKTPACQARTKDLGYKAHSTADIQLCKDCVFF